MDPDSALARIKEFDRRLDEIMASDRPARVKLVRVRHIRKEFMTEMIEILEMPDAHNSRD
jgi:hypothetical protein